MNKLLPWLPIILAALALSCTMGSVAITPDPSVAQLSGNGYLASRSVCGVMPSLLPSFLDHIPPMSLAPGLFQGREKQIEGKLHDITAMLPELPPIGGASFDRIIVKATSEFL